MTQIKVIFLIILMILITAIIAVKRPVMHKQVLIEDINFSFFAEAPKVQSSDNRNDNDKAESTSPKNNLGSQNELADNNTRVDEATRVVSAPKIIQKIVEPKENKVVEKPPKVQGKPQSSKDSVSKPQVNQVIQKPEPVIIKKEVVDVPKQLTEEEEIIAWNKWRSDLQNQVMRDAKIGAPIGTVFKFSFTVDKFGTVSNLKVWSTDPIYTNLAIRVIRPIITSYQGQPVLDFPEGTKRIITNVTGGFVMSTQTGYSSPSDYSDYEKVKK